MVVQLRTLQLKLRSDAKFDGVVEFEEIRIIETTNKEGEKVKVVMGRSGEIRIVDPKSNKVFTTNHVPYGSFLKVKDGEKVKKGD